MFPVILLLIARRSLRFFWYVTAGVFVYEWFPEVRTHHLMSQSAVNTTQYIAPLLGSFNIVCLAARNSDWVSYIFGGAEANEGMGLLGFGVDWANITSRPFYYPLSTQISNYVGWAVNYFLLPAIFAANVWKSKNFPFISQNLFCACRVPQLFMGSCRRLNLTDARLCSREWLDLQPELDPEPVRHHPHRCI